MKRTTRLPSSDIILYGADYNPDQWLGREDILLDDIRLMRKAGVTSASVGIFSWTALEPEPGEYDFGWLDEVMDRFGEAGLRVFLATPSGSKPVWLSELHPEIRRVGPDGRRESSGGRHNHCLTSPVYREAVRRINRELALRYGQHPVLALWHLGNEFNGECHCELCRSAFRDWLRQRYGSLEDLNKAWWTSFWNQTFTAWDQIPSQNSAIDALAVDWLRFVNDQHCSFLENEMIPLREITPGIPCTTNFMGTHSMNNYWQWARKMDCISNDHYPQPDDREDSWKRSLGSDFVHSLVRGLAHGDPWILMECSPSSVNWGRVNKLKRPGVHMQEVLQAVANGADAVHYFQWRKGRGGFEKYHGAVVDHEGSSRSRVFHECSEVGGILKKLAPVTGIRTDEAPVAMVFDWESRWALNASAGPKKSSFGDLYSSFCNEHFRALRSAGIDVDIVPVDADLSRYSAVITPALYLLGEQDAANLTGYVERGGCWVATCLTGYVDSNNRCWEGGFPGPDMRRVFGLWNEEVDYLFDDEIIKLRNEHDGFGMPFNATDVVEHLHAEGATPMVSIDSDIFAGSPIILRNAYQKGRAYYIGARLDDDSLLEFYRVFAGELGLPTISLPKGVVKKTRIGVDGPVEFLFNYNRQEVQVDLGSETFQRVSDRALLTSRATLPPYATLIRGVDLREDPGTSSNHHHLTPAPHELTAPSPV